MTPLAKRQEMLPSHSWGTLACQPASLPALAMGVSILLCPFFPASHSSDFDLPGRQDKQRSAFLFHVLAPNLSFLPSSLSQTRKK